MFDGLKTWLPRYLMTYLESSDSPATTANTYQPYVLQGWPGGVPTTRRIRATPLPVSMALAGQTMVRLCWNVIATSRTAQVKIAARIWGTLTQKPSPTWPRTWTVMITAATCNRGSRMLGRNTG